ncbi:hypothetical protein MAIC_36880 [Mycolicibacterium aichiense]|uniref:Uncharacterized protein n=2 Tax=Mycolicibacterium aichiense TaxID=1799 RepID=A0AAD1HQ30_9MYCO|nr:hypothetical protein MAIC_36880 [Mycolicibacterium aichiense]STZ82679.1 Uncharacterised protein [Mycolicibacterium aichiense]
MLLEDPAPSFAGGLTARVESAFSASSPVPLRRPFPRPAPTRPFHPNDAAQARRFGQLMQDEIDELEELIAVAQHRWTSRCDAGWGAARTPEPVLRLREKLKEVRRLQEALLARFGTD